MKIFIDIETIPNIQHIADNKKSAILELFKKKHNKDDDKDWLNNQWALYPETGTIKAIWYSYFADIQIDKIHIWVEKDLLQDFHFLCDQSNITFIWRNIKKFDIPYIIKSFAMYDMPVPIALQWYANKKPREVNVIDLMEIWSAWNGKRDSLESCCLSLWLDNPKDNNHGDQVKNMSDDNISIYLSKDIQAIRDIYTKFINLKII